MLAGSRRKCDMQCYKTIILHYQQFPSLVPCLDSVATLELEDSLHELLTKFRLD
jgi:hypothetical protein